MKPGLCHSRWSARWPRLRFSTRAFATLRPTLCTPYPPSRNSPSSPLPAPLPPTPHTTESLSFPRGYENMWVFVGIGLLWCAVPSTVSQIGTCMVGATINAKCRDSFSKLIFDPFVKHVRKRGTAIFNLWHWFREMEHAIAGHSLTFHCPLFRKRRKNTPDCYFEIFMGNWYSLLYLNISI